MSTVKDGRKKAMEPAVISWKQKKDVADEEEEALVKDIEDLRSWTEMIDAMNDEQLKEYLKNRPEELKTLKIQKSKPRQKVQRFRKAKSSASMGIMASVWKFHKEDSEDSVRPDV
ncbi:CWF protein [Salix suchowensis]|nr:CWF protein [Salix suchowensis]